MKVAWLSSTHSTCVHAEWKISSEETNVEEAVRKAVLRKGNVKLETPWGLTLFHPDDMPFARQECPDTFTHFRKICETQCTVRPLLPTRPLADKPFPLLDEFKGELPAGFLPAEVTENLRLRLGVDQIRTDPRGIHLAGGETAGLERLDSYLFQTNAIATYKETRNGLIGLQYSSKFSPYLAHGCLSPREIYFAIQRYEQTKVKNDSTYWLVFELLWRDFFKFIGLRHGDRLFYRSGLMRVRDRGWSMEAEKFRRWQQGQTGVPWVDAAMRELLYTGFMSNRSRQNVASFLTQSLGMDWRLGAAWFESTLIDHDVHANYGNWQYGAGVGNDPRGMASRTMLSSSSSSSPYSSSSSSSYDQNYYVYRLTQVQHDQAGARLRSAGRVHSIVVSGAQAVSARFSRALHAVEITGTDPQLSRAHDLGTRVGTTWRRQKE